MQFTWKTGAALATALLVGWWGMGQLKPLGQLIPNTRAMVTTTKEILAETHKLHEGVGHVSTNLAKVKEQQRLLREQKRLMGDIVKGLEQQEQLAGGAKELMLRLLETEATTAGLTKAADRAGAATLAAVEANTRQLEQLGTATQRIKRAGARIDGQMDDLITEMEEAATTFAVIAKYKEAAGRAADRPASWWERVKGWWPWNR